MEQPNIEPKKKPKREITGVVEPKLVRMISFTIITLSLAALHGFVHFGNLAIHSIRRGMARRRNIHRRQRRHRNFYFRQRKVRLINF